MAGICAGRDIERGVHKPPTNKIVRDVTRFNIHIEKPDNKDTQWAVLEPNDEPPQMGSSWT